MKQFFLIFCLFVGVLHAQTKVVRVDIGMIGPAAERVLKSALDFAREEQANALFLQLDTPGGMLESTRAIVQSMMSAEIPVIVWVGPDGARAASAGAFILLAANFATMASGTNVGASTPIEISTTTGTVQDAEKKATEDTRAFIESIAKTRGRNIEMARSFVTTAASISAEEALEQKIIDAIAADRLSAMEQALGRTFKIGSQEITLSGPLTWVQYQETWSEQLLKIIGHPQVVYLLFLAGIVGIGFELTHPGAVLPGVFGLIAMLLSLMGVQTLPIDFGGLALFCAGIAFMIAEIFVPSFGVLGVGGVLAFVIGSIFLIDQKAAPGLNVGWMAIAPGALIFAVAILGIGYLVWKVQRLKQRNEVGALGVVTQVHDDYLMVRISGELWRAKSSEALVLGQKIRVESRQDLILNVRKEETT